VARVRAGARPGQLASYLDELGGVADPEALYLLEGGGNDLSAAMWGFVGAGDWAGAEAFVEDAAQGMVGSLQMLADARGIIDQPRGRRCPGGRSRR
jgi:hypothetical protein